MSRTRQPPADAGDARAPPMPRLLDVHGNPIDPSFTMEFAPGVDGQESAGSIYHVPSAPDGRRGVVGIDPIMDMLRAAGFAGDTVHFVTVPREAEEEARLDQVRYQKAYPARLY